jgi:hypothetical protein
MRLEETIQGPRPASYNTQNRTHGGTIGSPWAGSPSRYLMPAGRTWEPSSRAERSMRCNPWRDPRGASTGYRGKTAEDNLTPRVVLVSLKVLRKQGRQDSFSAGLDRGFLFTEMGGITRDGRRCYTEPHQEALRLLRRWERKPKPAAGWGAQHRRV